MKNFEAYEKEIKMYGCNFALQVDDTLIQCTRLGCEKCKFGYNFSEGVGCAYMRASWLYEEYQKPKIKIPLATKVILENLNKKWEWIVKDEDGTVWFYKYKPYKISHEWDCEDGNGTYNVTKAFEEELFNFLSWDDEEPTNIKELLENCEMID